MATNNKIRFENNVFPLPKLPKHVVKDKVKWVLMPAKIILDSVNLWPERQNKLTSILNSLGVMSILFVMIGQIYYLYQDMSDLASAAFVLTTFIANIETMGRQFLIIYHKQRLITLLHVMYFEFWPSNIAGEELANKLNKQSWYIISYCSMYTLSAFICIAQLFMVPLLAVNGHLALLSTYPFAYWKSPLYEILHVWHGIVGDLIIFVICAVDLFFVTLLWNCIVQFILLRHYLQTNFEGNVVERKEGVKALLKCIAYHNKLIRTCKEMEDIFTYFILLLFLTSIGTVCISCFVATVMPEQAGTCGSYFLGHLCQLFIYCYLGTQLIYESTALSDAVFHCGWHLSDKPLELRNSLVMLLMRSQKGEQITAAKFAILDLSSFMKVIKLSFSVFTLLNSLLEK